MAKNSTKEKILSALAKTENYIKTQAQNVKESVKKDEHEQDEQLDEFVEEELEFNDESQNEHHEEVQEDFDSEEVEEQEQQSVVDLSKIMIKDENPTNSKHKKDVEESMDDSELDELFEALDDLEMDMDDEVREEETHHEEEVQEEVQDDESNPEDESSYASEEEELVENAQDEEMSQTQETLVKQSLEASSDLANVDVSLFSHEKFVSFVKEYENPVHKIKLMGRRISYLNSLVKRLQTTNNELKDRSLNLASNYENVKKDEEKVINDKVSRKIGDLFLDIIPSIDIFEMAISNEVENPELKKWLIGFKMIYNQLYGILESNGIQKMDIKQGDKPDHNFHNQIELKKTDEIEPGLIYAVKQSGYLYKDKLLRVASVVISAPLDDEEKVASKDESTDKSSDDESSNDSNE